jgi:hypothetical protein
MLPLGKIGIRAEVGEPRMTAFTPAEQQTMMTLWSIFRSPLMFGGDLPSNDAATLALIDNPEVLAVDQHSTGGHQVYRSKDTITWLAAQPGGKGQYVAVFNIGETRNQVRLSWRQAGVAAERANARDLWLRKDVGSRAGIDVDLAPHASALYLVSP